MRFILRILLFFFIFIPLLILIVAIMMFQNSSKTNSCAHKNITSTKILATCSTQGYTSHICNDCNYSYVSDAQPTTSHSYTSYTVSPTCNLEGYTLYICACGDSYKSEITSTVDHSFSTATIAPTCSSEGYDEHVCSVCGYLFRDAISNMTDHNFEKKTYLPTALSDGFTEYRCACSESYTEAQISYSEILSSPYVDGTAVLSRGIDVSRWNHQIDMASGEYLPIDWNLIKNSGFDFVILKAGSTKSGKEPTFESDYAGAKAAGLMVGAYFYTYSSDVEGVKQDVENLLYYIEGKSFEFPIYFDIEDPLLITLGKERLTELCEVFICSMQEKGYYSALYTNNNWLTNILDTSRILSLFDIWYARYPETETPVWNEEKYGRRLSMWQYTQYGEIAGIDGYFDMNLCYRDYFNIMKKWGLNGFKKEESKIEE